jgi:hypothetical protein
MQWCRSHCNIKVYQPNQSPEKKDVGNKKCEIVPQLDLLSLFPFTALLFLNGRRTKNLDCGPGWGVEPTRKEASA